jgi:hypothetical protein
MRLRGLGQRERVRQHELLNTAVHAESVSVAVSVPCRFHSFSSTHTLVYLDTHFHHTRHTTLPCPRASTFPLPLMEDESRVPRGLVGGSPSDTDAGSHAAFDPTAATATAAEQPAEDTGHMQHDQQDHGVGAGEPEPGPFANTGDEASVFTSGATATSPTTSDNTPAGHATGEHKDPTPQTDLPASPRSGGTAGFVAPSSYLRPLAVTRDREEQPRTASQPFAASETGVKRPMHPLDREQREGLVSAFFTACWKRAILEKRHVCV